MMSRGLIAFIVVVCISLASLVIISMKESAKNARKRSNDIMEQFRTIDKDLQGNKEVIDSLNNLLFDSLNNRLK